MQTTHERASQNTENQIVENRGRSAQGRESILPVISRTNHVIRLQETEEMTRGMLDLLMEITLADSAYFFQLDFATDELVITHVRGDIESQYLIGLRLNRERGLPGAALSDTRIVVVGDLISEPDWLLAADPVRAARKRNVINLPIANEERILGVVQLYNFQKAEIDLLMVLGESLAIELERRKEVDTTLKSNQRLLQLVDILSELAGTVDRNRLLHLVTENASRLVGAERSSVFLVDPNTREMLFQVAYQAPESPDNIDRPAAVNPRGKSSHKHPGAKIPPGQVQANEFSYFNRSAITVPIRTDSSSTEPGDDRKHVLGGLMVLNKQNSSFQEEDAMLMQMLANQASASLQVAEMYESAGELFLGVIRALATAIDMKDPYTQGHSQRVSDYSVKIGRELGLDETAVNDLRIGSLFHDIGKIGIPDAILGKNGRLNDHEIEIIRLHPNTGVNILKQVKLLEPMTPAILEHHERLDGSGYPAKLTDRQISWMGRIVAVADVYDAMTSNRPYRSAVSQQEVLSFLHAKAGSQFDAECVWALTRVVESSDLNRPSGTGYLYSSYLP